LRTLLQDIKPANLPGVSLSIGEPKHPAPQIALDALTESLRSVEQYPSTKGSERLRQSIAQWLAARFNLQDTSRLSERHILPVNGTREGLFAIAQCLLDRSSNQRTVLMPNPFYQIYEGATLLAGCEPEFYSIAGAADDSIDQLSDEQLNRCQMIYICTPGNPTGDVLSSEALQRLIERAHKHDFIIVSDECYSEIYREEIGPPAGLLQASQACGNTNHAHCLAFHSLSKRSNLPGLRSGFVAGDADLIARFLTYRTYHGCSMSGPVQEASIAAWCDEQHVRANRTEYDAKYKAVLQILQPVLPLSVPPAGFYLWPRLPIDDRLFTQTLLATQNVRVVPGSYLAREDDEGQGNPGKHHLRLALVASSTTPGNSATPSHRHRPVLKLALPSKRQLPCSTMVKHALRNPWALATGRSMSG